MKKVLVILLAALLGSSVIVAQETAGDTAAKKEKKAAKEMRWHGRIVRANKDNSTMDVARGNVEKTVIYDSSTRWTHKGKEADQGEFKDGSDVVVLGSYDEKGRLMAHRIDLRQ
jgi:hypothetical protein